MADDKKYFAFEGGGGKGAAYLAVAQALEDISTATKANAYDRISGFSGSSAGAMTAVLLALETRSDVLDYLTSSGAFESMFPRGSTLSESHHPYWRGFIQQAVTNSVSQQRSTFHYAMIYAPEAIKKAFSDTHKTVSTEIVEDKLTGLAACVSGINPIGGSLVLELAVLIDRNNLISSFLGNQVNKFIAKKGVDTTLLNKGTISNLVATGGLFTGEEVMNFALILSWLVKTRNSKFNNLTKDDVARLGIFKDIAAGLRRDYLSNETKSGYVMDDFGFLHIADLPLTGAQYNAYYEKAMKESREVFTTATEDTHKGNMTSWKISDKVLLTFQDLYDLTGKELVLTSVNLLDGVTYYFSHWTTPDFPVAAAVAMSMNLPVWAPIYVRYTSPAGMKYDGWYFDGGVNHNLPMRVFNTKWNEYPQTYRSRDKGNMGTTSHLFYGFKLDPTETHYLKHFPGAFSVAGAIGSMKMEQATYNVYHEFDKVVTLGTDGLSLLKFTPDSNVFPNTNKINRKLVYDKLKAWGFF